MATAVEIRKTRSGRPKVDPLDRVAIHEDAKARIDRTLAEAEVAAAQHVADLPKVARAEANALRQEAAAAIAAQAAAEKALTSDPKTRAALDEATRKAAVAARAAEDASVRAAILADPSNPEAVTIANRTRTEDVLTAVAALERTADDVIEEKEAYMFRLALSLHLYDGARGVSNAIGIGREAFSKRVVRALPGEHRSVMVWSEKAGKEIPQPVPWDQEESVRLAQKHKIRRYGNAVTELPKIAREVAGAHAIKDHIRPIRNDLIKELAAQGATRVEIAEIIGRQPSRVSHIVTGRGR